MARKKTKQEWEQILQDELNYQIGQCIEKYKNRTMGELWEALDEIKAKFAKRWKARVESQ